MGKAAGEKGVLWNGVETAPGVREWVHKASVGFLVHNFACHPLLAWTLSDAFHWDSQTSTSHTVALSFKICPPKKNEGILTASWEDVHRTFYSAWLICKCKSSYSLGKVSLPALLCSYRVAAWQRDLDTPPWRREERKKHSHLERSPLPLWTARVHEMLAVTLLPLEPSTLPEPGQPSLNWEKAHMHRLTEVPRNLYNIG